MSSLVNSLNFLFRHNNTILKNAGLTKKLSWFAITATAFFFYQLYKKISQPPRQLRHIPYLNYFQMMNVLMRREPISQYSRRLVEPLLSISQGLYTVSYINWPKKVHT